MFWKEGNTQKQFIIGPYPTISLKEARENATPSMGCWCKALTPTNNIVLNRSNRTRSPPLTSRVVAQEWYAKRTVTQTENTRRLKMQRLERHVFPSFGDLPIKQLKPRDIILALHAIESQGHRKMTRRVGHARVVGYLEYGTGQTGQAARVHKERPQKGYGNFSHKIWCQCFKKNKADYNRKADGRRIITILLRNTREETARTFLRPSKRIQAQRLTTTADGRERPTVSPFHLLMKYHAIELNSRVFSQANMSIDLTCYNLFYQFSIQNRKYPDMLR